MNILNQFLQERLLLALAAAAFCASLYFSHWLQPLDRVVYDLVNEAAPLAAADDLVIVAIDEASLEELGRWPWPRENHVQLLRELGRQSVQAVAFDVLFTEPYPDYPEVDALLARELSALQSVILPVFIGKTNLSGQLQELPPTDVLRDAAAALGHVHIEVDNDGVARSVYLREGVGSPHWPHFTVALAEQLDMLPKTLPGALPSPARQSRASENTIMRSHANLVSFMGPAGTVPQVSYVDLMKGRYAPHELQDKIVFIGATAAGHVDNINTSMGQVPGVEINANIFQALRTGRLSRTVASWQSSATAFAIIFATVFGFTRLGPGGLLAAAVLTALGVTVAAYIGFRYFQLWFSPAPIIATLVLAYPLWNWLRLAVALDFIRQHLHSLEKENRGLVLGLRDQLPARKYAGDPVNQVLHQVEDASRLAERNRKIIQHALEQLLSGVILATPTGRVLLANANAQRLLGMDAGEHNILQFLRNCETDELTRLAAAMGSLAQPTTPVHEEIHHARTDMHLLVQCDLIGLDRPLLLIVLTDISELKQSEQRRTDALNFLSHDLRAPLNSVLALLEQSRDDSRRSADRELLDTIERHVRANLSYAENYIQLAKLDHDVARDFDLCDGRSLVDDAVSQLYHTAARRRIDISIDYSERDIWVNCSRDLVERALINLLDNAIKHSSRAGQVSILLDQRGDSAVFAVMDRGPGIDPKDMQRIFEAYEQGSFSAGGVGLGLRFVTAVARLHGGSISVTNRTDGGSSFLLRLPAEAG